MPTTTTSEVATKKEAPSVCLVMMIKNESAVLGRALEHVAFHCQQAVILDTGSTDEEEDRCYDIASEHFPDRDQLAWRSLNFVNFAHNRTMLVRMAQAWSHCDYLLMLDADDRLMIPPSICACGCVIDACGRLVKGCGAPGFHAQEVTGGGFGPVFDGNADLYHIPIDYNGLRYNRAALMRRARPDKTPFPWVYVCPVHEALTTDAPFTSVVLDNCVILPGGDGARSKRPAAEKFAADAEMLLRHLRHSPTDVRAAYYYAQSLRDAGQHMSAAAAYLRRAELGGWEEEVFSALLEAAKCQDRMYREAGKDNPVEFSRVLDAYLTAYHARQTRAEPLFHAMAFATAAGHPAIADQMMPAWRSIPLATDTLFVEQWAYHRKEPDNG
jgi:hypothetical protein